MTTSSDDAPVTSTIRVIGSGNAFNSDGRAHSSFLLRGEGTRPLLIDAGGTTLFRLQQSGFDAESIDAVVVTHFHADHTFGIPFLLMFMKYVASRTRPFVIAGPRGVERGVGEVVERAYPGAVLDFDVEYRELSGGECDLGGLRFDPRPVTHRPESVGYRVTFPGGKRVAFSGDAAFDERLFALVDGVDLAFVEVSLLSQCERPIAHVSIEELIERRDALRCSRLVFTHLSDRIARRLERERLGVAAHDGMTISI